MRIYRAVHDCGALMVSDDEHTVQVLLAGHRCLSPLDVQPAPIDCKTRAAYHERDHHCAVCAVLSRYEPRPNRRTRQEQITDLLRAGKSAQWVAANTGEPMRAVMVVLERMRHGIEVAS